jgi:ribosomal protein S18 acetylase RimI-like enzyme
MTESTIKYRIANNLDIPAMACLRARHWGTEEYWEKRIAGYLRGDVNPQQSLAPRIVYVATKDEAIVGLIAGHLTRRFGCDGELEWIDVGFQYCGMGISTELLHQLAAWFMSLKALYICVDCAPDNAVAQNFYKRNGAENRNEHWLIWKDISVLLTNKTS